MFEFLENLGNFHVIILTALAAYVLMCMWKRTYGNVCPHHGSNLQPFCSECSQVVEHMTGGQTAALVIGLIVFAIIVGVIIWWVVSRRRAGKSLRPTLTKSRLFRALPGQVQERFQPTVTQEEGIYGEEGYGEEGYGEEGYGEEGYGEEA